MNKKIKNGTTLTDIIEINPEMDDLSVELIGKDGKVIQKIHHLGSKKQQEVNVVVVHRRPSDVKRAKNAE